MGDQSSREGPLGRRPIEIFLLVLVALAAIGFFVGIDQSADEIDGLPQLQQDRPRPDRRSAPRAATRS